MNTRYIYFDFFHYLNHISNCHFFICPPPQSTFLFHSFLSSLCSAIFSLFIFFSLTSFSSVNSVIISPSAAFDLLSIAFTSLVPFSAPLSFFPSFLFFPIT
jgi:hypothetical protein